MGARKVIAQQLKFFEMPRLAEFNVAITHGFEVPKDIEFDPQADLPVCVMASAHHLWKEIANTH